ncbi:hypothetical protein RHSIM_Rhsim09G0079400 [Rhododendron simsii]|uniref:Uncharacterized protein n=1 Tax=Rhododendron simsii TaxID=118357 RepID=A0A834GDZ0_RHOSS|nr:hypothetical protein RHSIM_Rhsim09G0079400 [Rhododendron simsii]
MVTSVGKEEHRVVSNHPKESRSSRPDSIGEELSDSEDELLEVLEGVVSSNQEGRVLTPGIKTATSPSKVHSEIKSSLANDPPDPLDIGVSKVAAELVSKGSAGFNKFLSKSAKKRLKKQAKEESLCSSSNGGNLTIPPSPLIKGISSTRSSYQSIQNSSFHRILRELLLSYSTSATVAAIMVEISCYITRASDDDDAVAAVLTASSARSEGDVLCIVYSPFSAFIPCDYATLLLYYCTMLLLSHGRTEFVQSQLVQQNSQIGQTLCLFCYVHSYHEGFTWENSTPNLAADCCVRGCLLLQMLLHLRFNCWRGPSSDRIAGMGHSMARS